MDSQSIMEGKKIDMSDCPRVAVFMHSADTYDEGVRVVGDKVSESLATSLVVRRFELSFMRGIHEARRFRPNLCHFFLSYSDWKSAVIPWMISRVLLRSKLCVSALQLRPSTSIRILLRFFKPDLVIVQSPMAKDFFEKLGVKSAIIFHGVDRHKFSPATDDERARLRDKYRVPGKDLVILHVGAINKARGALSMRKLVGRDRTVIVVGRASTPQDSRIASALVQSGCIVINEYLPDIAEVYRMSDVYVFPTENPSSAIDLPLSVIEAVSSGCLAISTRFRGVPNWVVQTNLHRRVILVDDSHEISNIVKGITTVTVRERIGCAVHIADWKEISEEVMSAYRGLSGIRIEPTPDFSGKDPELPPSGADIGCTDNRMEE